MGSEVIILTDCDFSSEYHHSRNLNENTPMGARLPSNQCDQLLLPLEMQLGSCSSSALVRVSPEREQEVDCTPVFKERIKVTYLRDREVENRIPSS